MHINVHPFLKYVYIYTHMYIVSSVGGLRGRELSLGLGQRSLEEKGQGEV